MTLPSQKHYFVRRTKGPHETYIQQVAGVIQNLPEKREKGALPKAAEQKLSSAFFFVLFRGNFLSIQPYGGILTTNTA